MLFLTAGPYVPFAGQKEKGKGENMILLKRDTFTYLYLSEKTEKYWLQFGRHNVEQGKENNSVNCP